MDHFAKQDQHGQVGLVVLLIGAVLLTIGLGVASQSVMEINTARLESESSQAFNAAEQAIEMALQDPSVPSTSLDLPGGYQVNVGVEEQKLSYQSTILVGHSSQLLMEGVTDLTLTWNDPSCTKSSGHTGIVLTLIDANGAVERHAYSQGCGDGLETVNCTGAGVCTQTMDVDSIATGNFNGVGAIARIKALFNDVQLTAGLAGNPLTQGYIVTSTANGDSGESRSVQVNKSVAAAPSVFDHALFSGTNLSHQ